MAISSKEAHILVFPYPAQGHMISFLDLIHNLIIKSDRRSLTVTIVVTPKNLHLLNPLLSFHQSSFPIETLILPFPSHPAIPAGVENTKDLPAHIAFKVMTEALGQLRNPIFDWFRTHRASAMITDVFLGWTQDLACEVGVKRFVFCPMGAMALSVIYSLWRDLPRQEANRVVSCNGIPNCPEFPWSQISGMYRSYIEGESVGEFIKEGFTGNIKSWGLIVNTFSALEGIYVDHLMNELGHDRVWAVGPTIAEFQALLSNEQMTAIALALEISRGANVVPDSIELAKALVESTSENRVARERVMKLGRAAVEAIKDGGSSDKDLELSTRTPAKKATRPHLASPLFPMSGFHAVSLAMESSLTHFVSLSI
ncbi:hypothetical protein ACFE04_009169 [Oxalis oulophora]